MLQHPPPKHPAGNEKNREELHQKRDSSFHPHKWTSLSTRPASHLLATITNRSGLMDDIEPELLRFECCGILIRFERCGSAVVAFSFDSDVAI